MAEQIGLPNALPADDEPAEIVLHIGFAKTGTSAVQAMMVRERSALLAARIAYPDLGVRFNAHHGLAGLLIEHENALIPAPDLTADQLIDGLQQAVASGAKRIVLSSEGLSTAHVVRPAVGELRTRFSVRVVAVMRPVLDWIDSLLNQMTKTAMFRPRDWDQRAVTAQILRRDARFDHQLALWADAVGADNLTLVALEPGDDFLTANLAAIGLDAGLAGGADPAAANRSSGLDELHFLEWFASSSPEPDHDHKVRVARWLRSYEPPSEPFCLIHPDLVDEAATVAAEVSSAISGRYFDGATVLADSVDLSTAVRTQPPDPSRIVRVAGHVLTEADRDRRRLVRALDAARRDQPGT